MKIGVFGGTFNPVHFGHLANCEFLRCTAGLDLVLFLPAKIPVHKSSSELADPEDRCRMISLAIADNPFFQLSRIEVDRAEDSYTVFTLDTLKKIYPCDHIYLIMGSDSFNELDTWKEWKTILREVSILVMTRPGDPALRGDILELTPGSLSFENPLIDLSSGEIRKRVQKGLSVKYQVPDTVNSYIIERGLYRI